MITLSIKNLIFGIGLNTGDQLLGFSPVILASANVSDKIITTSNVSFFCGPFLLFHANRRIIK